MSEIVEALRKYLGDPIGSPSSNNYKYRCPFHDDRSPSFYVNGVNGVAFCHAGCGGFSLSSLLYNLGASRRTISAAADIVGRVTPPTLRADLRKRTVVEPIPEEILGVFENNCPAALLDDGFNMRTLRQYGVGYDVHHDWPVYPIRDHLGRLVGLSGRAEWGYNVYSKDEYAAFMENPPKSAVKKSWFVWNMHNVYPTAFHGDGVEFLIVVEGFKACLWLIQNGYPNTVALMGSYLSRLQKNLLTRIGGTILLFLDQDNAGRRGTEICVEQLAPQMLVKEVRYPFEGKLQPDDLAPEFLASAISNAVPSYMRRRHP